ncbi:DUF885 domain-containing protein, partial [Pseudoalteromonas phenolica]
LIPQFAVHIVADVTQSGFWGAKPNFRDSFTLQDKKALKHKYKAMIRNKLVPAYSKMTTFLKEVYFPNSRN